MRRVIREEEKGKVRRSYLTRGKYAEQITRYVEFFPKSQMHFVLLEEVRADPEPVVKRVLRFLDLSPELEIRNVKVNHAQYFAVPRSILVARLATFLGPSRISQWLRKINSSTDSGYPPMNDDTRALLQQDFKPHTAELARLIERDLSIWNR